MIPKRVTLQNFLSYGEHADEHGTVGPGAVIAFDDVEPLWVVGGPNGVGKSAVFDAMTYCLYAEHRGGGQGHEDLIRHGADRFSVSFDFEFNGHDYRITRTRPRKGRTTQAVERKDGECWKRVPDVDSAKEVDGWVVRTLGLSFEAFCASVLLRQGHADDILDAKPAARLDTLKKVIGVERYEKLSQDVHEASEEKKRELKRLTAERLNVEEVSEKRVEEELAAVERAAAARELADAARTRAVAAVPQAEQWARLNAQAADLTRKLADADERSRDADAIRRDHAEFVELSKVVPLLREVIPLRQKVADATAKRADATTRRDGLRAEVKQNGERAETLRVEANHQRQTASDLANDLRTATSERDRLTGLLTVADELATVRTQADDFPPELDDDLAAATAEKKSAAEAERAAAVAEAEISSQLKDAKKLQKAFADVRVGVTCSQCGQEVTAKHAEDERTRLADRVAQLGVQMSDAKEKTAAATADLESADSRVKSLTNDTARRDRVRQRQADLERSLTALGGTTDPVAVRGDITRLADLLTELQARHTTARTRQTAAERELQELEPVVRRQETDLQRLEADLVTLGTDLASDTATLAGLLARLPDAWKDAADAATPTARLKALTDDGIQQRFKDLEADTALRREWEEQRANVAQEMAAVPADARTPVDDARRAQRSAERAFTESDSAHRAAVATHAESVRLRDQLAKLTADIAAAETDARVHATLDRHLGKGGLQRELIREAEAAIVRLTQQTLANLSGGDLSVALAEADGDDKAFDLLVRRGGDQEPTPVKMLSGSQKFRVAVSVALAIGRFATGQARPLECVIIDEGFGSLDKDGLRAAADELNRLKDMKELKRVIVVSHQEEFTDQFPVVIRLSKGDAGTTAEAVRQRR